MLNIKKTYFIIIGLMGMTVIFGQTDTLQKRVEVVKPYDPSVTDAYKINYLPVISDTTKITPRYDYKTRFYHYNTMFSVKPISSAKMVGEPLNELYNSFVRFGIGNYTTPLIEANYHNLRSKNYSYGVSGQFLGSYGKIKLENNERSPLGYNNSFLNLFGKKMWNNYVLGAKLNYSHLAGNYYGYNTNLLPSVIVPVVGQSVNSFSGDLVFKSIHIDSIHLNSKAELNYGFSSDKYDFSENKIKISSSFDKFWNKERIGLDFELKSIMPNSNLASDSYIDVMFRPWISTFGDNWSVKAGVSAVYYTTPTTSKTLYFPFGNIQYNLANNFLVPYLTVDGGVKIYSYQDLLNENIYVTPGTFVEPENNKLKMRGGFKGVFSQVLSYNFSASYSLIDNMHFFVNDKLYSSNQSSFNVVYDDIELVNIGGQVSVNTSEKLSFDLMGNYYNYKTGLIEKPWHKPDWDMSFITRYNMQDKILIGVDIMAISSRWAMSNYVGSPILLDGAINLNLNVEYRYTPVLSFFTKLTNITSQKYQMWNQYPSERFGFIIGASYKL